MFTHAPPGVSFWQFRPLTTDDIISAIQPDKTLAADPIPTSVLKQTADVVAPNSSTVRGPLVTSRLRLKRRSSLQL